MKNLIVIFAMVLSWGAWAEVREIQSMQDILKEVDAGTLVVFDIDNTTLQPVNQLASDQWFYYLGNKFEGKDKLPSEKAWRKAEEVWNKAQWLVQVKPVEATTPKLIGDLQKKGIKVMALTARNFEIIDITRQQLITHGIDFSKTAPWSRDMEIRLDDVAKFTKGILFQGEKNTKGKILVEFLKQAKFSPKKVVFVDDKHKHVKSMNEALQVLGGVPHVEFRYGNADGQVQAFNEDLQDAELFCNGQWTPTAEAKLKSVMTVATGKRAAE